MQIWTWKGWGRGGGGGKQMRIFQGKEEGNRSVFDHTFSWIM